MVNHIQNTSQAVAPTAPATEKAKELTPWYLSSLSSAEAPPVLPVSLMLDSVETATKKQAVKWLQEEVFPTISETDFSPLIPELELPDKKITEQDISALQKEFTQFPAQLSEKEIAAIFLQALCMQEEIGKESSAIEAERIKNAEMMIKKLREEYHRTLDEVKDGQQISEALSWAVLGLTGALLVSGIISALATGGATLPIVISSTAGAAQGGVLIAKGSYDYNNQIGEGNAFQIRFQIAEEHNQIRFTIQELNEKLQDTHGHFKDISATFANGSQTVRRIFS